MMRPVLGIAIAKAKFDTCLLLPHSTYQRKVFPNTPAGFMLLTRWLDQHTSERVHGSLEATGTYGAALALYLYEQQHVVSLINPAAIKAFAASRLTRSKTDRVDASLIARFCAAQHPPAWTPPATEVQELQALVRRLDALVEMRTMERNRLSTGEPLVAVRSSIAGHLAYLQQEITQTERLIQQHRYQHVLPVVRGHLSVTTRHIHLRTCHAALRHGPMLFLRHFTVWFLALLVRLTLHRRAPL